MLIIGAITVLTNGGYVSNEYAKPDFPTDPFGFTPEERLSHASDNLRYLRESLPSAFLEQQNHNGQPLYNTREVSHMADVQSVFQAAWTGGKMLLVFFLFLTTLITWRGRNSRHFFAGLQYGGILSASLIAVIGVLAIIGWNKWFTAFHLLFFLPGTWTFAQTDTLIRLFPLPFWFDGVLTVSALTLAGGILLGVMGWVLKRRWNANMI